MELLDVAGAGGAIAEFRVSLASGGTACTSVTAMIRLTKMVREIMDCRYVLPVSYGSDIELLWEADCVGSIPFEIESLKDLPGRDSEICIVPDARRSALIQSILSRPPLFRCEFFARLAIWQEDGRHFDLLLIDDKARPGFNYRSMNLMLEVIELLRREADLLMPILHDPRLRGAVHLDEAEILDRVSASAYAELIVDDRLQVLHANPRIERLLGKVAGQDIGSLIGNYAPHLTAALPVLCLRSMRSLVSSPLLEFSEARVSGESYCLAVMPLVANENGKRFAKVSISDMTGFNRRLMAVDAGAADAAKLAVQDPPSLEFLMDTLVKRPSMRIRNGVPYLTLRSWRSPLKEFQIKAIQHLKKHDLTVFSKRIAEDIAANLGTLVGAGAFRYVIPMPCGHSKRTDCLSVMIARQLAERLGIKVVEAFEHQQLSGKSHPKENVTRPPLLLKKIVKEPAILIDDVATSGAHIEEATKLLQQHCSAVMPIVWISGSATD